MLLLLSSNIVKPLHKQTERKAYYQAVAICLCLSTVAWLIMLLA